MPDNGYPHRDHTHTDGYRQRRNPLLDPQDPEQRDVLEQLAERRVLASRNRVLSSPEPARKYILPVRE